MTSLNFCNNNRDSDSIFNLYQNQYDNMILKLQNEDPSLINAINIDSNCLVKVGNGIRNDNQNWIINSSYKCISCLHLDRLLDLETYILETPFIIKYGNMINKKIKINKIDKKYQYNTSDINILLRKENSIFWEYIYNQLLGNSIGFLDCCPDEKIIQPITKYISLPYYINNLIVNEFIYRKYPELTGKIYSSFVCDNTSYIINEFIANEINLLDNDIQIDINILFYQLINLLRCYKKLHFSHGNPVYSNLLCLNRKINFNNKKIDFQLQLRNYYQSSITIPIENNNNYHRYGPFSNKSKIYLQELYNNYYFGKTKWFTHKKIPSNNYSGFYFILNEHNRHLLYHLINIGIPIYNGSFDLYSFMISLLSKKYLYEKMISNSKLYKWWQDFFLPGEYPKLLSKLSLWWNQIPEPSITDIQYILQDLHLKCDIIDDRYKNYPLDDSI
jgi:hypothetical protein